MGVLHGRNGNIAPLQPGIRAAFDKVNARYRRQAHQFIHRVNLGLFQQRIIRTIDHQAMPGRIDILPALVMALKMQSRRRNDAKQPL